jgi:hypothetical protein
MIAKKTTGSSFKSLMGYLTDPNKMEWLEQRRCHTEDSQKIAKKMQLTAGLSERTQKPVYHVSLSWTQADEPSKQQMLEVADGFINHMGLQDHQIAIVAHKDQDHPHIHLMVNRVHPGTGKAWEPYLYKGQGRDRSIEKTDYERIEQFLRSTEKQYGWTITPGKHFGPNSREFDKKAPELWEVKRAERIQKQAAGLGIEEEVDGRSVMQRAQDLKEELYQADSFSQFDAILAKEHLWLESKGQGMVITDGTYQVKASSISRGLSANSLEGKFGQDVKSYEAKRDANVDIADGLKAIDNWALQQERKELVSLKSLSKDQHYKAKRKLKRLKYVQNSLLSVKKEIRRTLKDAFGDWKQAHGNISEYIKETSFEEAQAELVANPQRFGVVQNPSAIVRASEAIAKFDSLHHKFSSRIWKMDKEQRQQRIAELSKTSNRYSSIVSNVTQQLADKAMNKTKAGRAVNKSVHRVIAVSRALSFMRDNPEKSMMKLAKQAGMSPAKGMKSEAGQAVKKTVMNANRYLKMVASLIRGPAGGPAKVLTSTIQSSMKRLGREGPGKGLSR